nr:MAG TPA: hypothetical protein [Bacteriophage sp.]
MPQNTSRPLHIEWSGFLFSEWQRRKKLLDDRPLTI